MRVEEDLVGSSEGEGALVGFHGLAVFLAAFGTHVGRWLGVEV